MPKIKVSNAKKIRSIIKDFKEFTATANDELHCPLCCCIVMHEKRFFVEQYVATLKHRKVIEKTNSAGTSDTQQHLSVLVNNKILPQNLFTLLYQVIYRWQN